MARADLFGPISQGHRFIPAKEGTRPYDGVTFDAYLFPRIPDPTWTDAYGQTRTASEMLTEHLWNVMGFVRFKRPFNWKTNAFYQAARNELRKRGIL